MRLARWAALVGLVGQVGLAGSVRAQQAGGDRLLELGRAAVQMAARGEAGALHKRFNDGMAAAVPLPAIEKLVRETLEAGPVGKLASESANAERRTYVAEHEWDRRRIRFEIAFDEAERISGLFIRYVGEEKGGDPYRNYRTKVKLRLPFDGEWWVFWGGLKVEQNYHVKSPDQRYAYDLVIRKNGSTHSGKGDQNEDYHCYRKPILAPAAGTVVGLKDGVPDNRPGAMNASEVPGNWVALDFGNREYGMFAHLVPGTIRVKVGQKVKPGQVLALCGNSGNSSEPHLHFHLQDKPNWFGGSRGKPAPFVGFLRNGKKANWAIPVRGDSIRPM